MNSSDLAKQLMAAVAGLSLAPEQSGKLLAFLELLERWTKKIDLVSPAPLEVLAERHIADSLAAWQLINTELNIPSDRSYLDIGSGAGLPGVVFAVMEPDRKVVLCEPREKRTMFLKEVRRELGFDNLEVVRARMEELDVEALSSVAADVPLGLVISRALGMEQQFVATALRLLAADGVAAQMLGPTWDGDADQIYKYQLPSSDQARKLAVWRPSA